MTLLRVSQCAAVIGVTALLLTGCEKMIPNTPVSITEEQRTILDALEPIQISRATNRNFFDIQCEDRNAIGTTGYYLTAKNTSMDSKEAVWVCAQKMKHLKCPDMAVISKNNNALAVEIDAYQTEYSKEDVEACVISAIENAPTVLRDTSKSAENKKSWN